MILQESENMNLVTKFTLKLNFLVLISQLLPFVILYLIIPSNYLFNTLFSISFIIVLMTNRFPHEYFHKLGGNLVGAESDINFKRLNASCTPRIMLNSQQLIIFALAPVFGK